MNEVPWRFIKGLLSKKERELHRLTVAEGPGVVMCALQSGVIVDSLVIEEGFFDDDKHIRLQAAVAASPAKKYTVSRDLFVRMAETRTPQGILAVIPFPFGFDERACRTTPSGALLAVACVDVQDPGNIGTVLRTSAAVGANQVLVLGESADPYSPKCIRSSAGACFLVGLSYSKDALGSLRSLAERGVQLVKTYPRDGLMPWEVDFCRPSCIVMGNEAKGLDKALDTLGGISVTVPMPGGTESLNVAIACGMLVYEAIRQRNGSFDRFRP